MSRNASPNMGTSTIRKENFATDSFLFPNNNPVAIVLPERDNPGKTPIIVRKAGSQDILNVQYIHLPETYLVGKYDLEMLCLPRIKINNININQSYTTQIKIPSPGIAIVQKNKPGYGSLYVIRNNTMEWIYNLREDDTQESILLQPGTYRIVFREKYEYQTIKTHTSTFIIRSDANTNVQIGE
jgi:Ca-activated chloride channel family protein